MKTATFIFNLYDVNSVGVLGPDVAKLMLEELYGESFLKENSRTRFARQLYLDSLSCYVVLHALIFSNQRHKSLLAVKMF